MCAEQLDREETDEPQPDDGDRLSECRFEQPGGVQRDRTQDGEGGALVGDRIRDTRAQIAWNRDHLGVRAVAHDTVAGAEALHAFADLHHHSGVAVPERERLVQTGEDGFQRRENPVGTNLLQHATHLVRLAPRPGEPRGLPEFQERTLAPGRDERRPGLNQKMARKKRRTGRIDDVDTPRPEILQHLSQGVSGDVIGRNGPPGLPRRCHGQRT